MTRIAELAEAKGESIFRIARIAHMPFQQLQDVLAGKAELAPLYARRVAVALGVPLEDLSAPAVVVEESAPPAKVAPSRKVIKKKRR